MRTNKDFWTVESVPPACERFWGPNVASRHIFIAKTEAESLIWKIVDQDRVWSYKSFSVNLPLCIKYAQKIVVKDQTYFRVFLVDFSVFVGDS